MMSDSLLLRLWKQIPYSPFFQVKFNIQLYHETKTCHVENPKILNLKWQYSVFLIVTFVP